MDGGSSGRGVGRYCSALKAAGVDLSSVELVTKQSVGAAGEQVSVQCKKDTAAAAQLISIPLSIVITAEALKQTVEYADVTAAYDTDSGAAVIVAWIMRQRFFSCAGEVPRPEGSTGQREEVWASYVGHLPSSFDVIFHWTEAECVLLQGTNLLASLPAAVAELRSVYHAMIVDGLCVQSPERWPREEATWERFLWAHSAYISRGFPIDILTHSEAGAHAHDGTAVTGVFSKTRARSPCLLPLIDSCDHDESVRVTWQLSESQKTVSLIFDDPFVKGQCVHNNYGAKFDEDLLLCYGFVVGKACYPVKLTNGKRYVLSHCNPLPEELVQDLAVMLGAEAEDYDDPDLGLAICDILLQLLLPRRDALLSAPQETGEECPERVRMARVYREGQRDVICSSLSAVVEKRKACELRQAHCY